MVVNIREKRELEMTKTQLKLSREFRLLDSYLSKYELLDSGKLKDDVLELLTIRIQKKSIRSYYIGRVYEYIQYQDQKKRNLRLELLVKKKIAFALEVIIVIQYLHNQILDGKRGITTLSKVNNNLICSNILRELLFEYIDEEIGKWGNEVVQLTRALIKQILLYVDFGQKLEKDFTNYDFYNSNEIIKFNKNNVLSQFTTLDCLEDILIKTKEGISKKNWLFYDLYFRRIFLTNGCLFTISTELVAQLMGASKIAKEDIVNFSICYGVTVQVVNDISDFIPSEDNPETVGKNDDDAFSDLKNGNITLPLIFHLEKGYNRNIEQYLNNPKDKSILKNQIILLKEIINTKGISKAQSVAYKTRTKAISYLDSINPITPELTSLADMGKWNKYYDIFKKYKKELI